MSSRHLDYDIHGLVGIRLLEPSDGDVRAISRQLGPLQAPLHRRPEIVIRFVKRLPTPKLHHLGLKQFAFSEDGFFVLRSQKASAKVRIDFSRLDSDCEIVCETGLRAVPLLMPIVGLHALSKDCTPLHASAFRLNGKGILVTGWSKGGKTEALLAFAAEGAEYVGDEWILLKSDGTEMFGLPENIRLWDWHLKSMPQLAPSVSARKRMIFRAIHAIDTLQAKLPANGWLGNSLPVDVLRQATPALLRQLNLRMSPQKIFGDRLGSLSSPVDRVFLMVSHDEQSIEVEPIAAEEIAQRMIYSNRYEHLPLLEHYLAFSFAFPAASNGILERLSDRQSEILHRALRTKESFLVRHPYPCSLKSLYQAMKPYCE